MAEVNKKAKMGEIQSFIDEVNVEYEKVHVQFEEQFWGTKMGLQDGDFTTEKLSSTKEAMEAWLRSPENLAKVDAFLASGEATAEQQKVLECFQRTFSCYQMADEEAVSLRAECTKIEDNLSASRNTMALGYTDPQTWVTPLAPNSPCMEKGPLYYAHTMLASLSCPTTGAPSWRSRRWACAR